MSYLVSPSILEHPSGMISLFIYALERVDLFHCYINGEITLSNCANSLTFSSILDILYLSSISGLTPCLIVVVVLRRHPHLHFVFTKNFSIDLPLLPDFRFLKQSTRIYKDDIHVRFHNYFFWVSEDQIRIAGHCFISPATLTIVTMVWTP